MEFTFTGITDLVKPYNIDIYPNPTNENFTLEADFGKLVKVTLILTDVTGREVMQLEVIEDVSSIRRSFTIGHLGAGIYSVQLVTNEGVATKRLVKR